MNTMTKFFVAANTSIYQMTGGRLGSQLGRQTVLLLHTVGRKSGKPFTTPLTFFRDGENYLVVASNWGQEAHPNWFLNLMQQERTTIQVKDKTIQVRARQAEGQEYERLWQVVTSRNPQYLQYSKGIARRIPVVVLAPLGQPVERMS